MNAQAPPKRSAPGREIAGAAKLRLPQAYHISLVLQAQWQREGDRLLNLYRHTKRPCHWRAYITHIAGMASRLERGGQ